jgi:hypothetical protein
MGAAGVCCTDVVGGEMVAGLGRHCGEIVMVYGWICHCRRTGR